MAPMTQVLWRKIILTDCGLGTPVLRLVEASSGAGGSSLAVPTPRTTPMAAPQIVRPQVGCGLPEVMLDSRHKQTYGNWNKIVDELFDKIAIRLDIASVVRLATCTKEFYRQVSQGTGSRCPNDGCGKLVAYHEFHDHKIAWPHGPCACTEPGSEVAAPPAALLAHFRHAHSMEVPSFRYSGSALLYIFETVWAPGSERVEFIGSGDDGTVFAVRFDALNSVDEESISVSLVCVRSAACLSRRYKVSWMGPWMGPHGYRSSVEFMATSSVSPGVAVLVAPDLSLAWHIRIDRIP